jgi:hypothetical protein
MRKRSIQRLMEDLREVKLARGPRVPTGRRDKDVAGYLSTECARLDNRIGVRNDQTGSHYSVACLAEPINDWIWLLSFFEGDQTWPQAGSFHSELR